MSETLTEPRKRKSVSVTDWVTITRIGYSRFPAKEGGSNDGAQVCGAEIHFNDTSSGTWRFYPGATGHDTGHAEMHALFQFVNHECKFDVSKYDAILNSETLKVKVGKKTIEIPCGIKVVCTAKPCCVFCSAMLGLLGIRPMDGNTKKVARRMGGTQWGMFPALRAFIAQKTGYSEAALREIDSVKLDL